MHDTAYNIGAEFLKIYSPVRDHLIIEIGSMDVNGSLRRACSGNVAYFGLDIEAGQGVDIVCQREKPFPIRSCSADIVISTSQMEHDPRFWVTFIEMCRIVKDGGLIYISAPSNGSFHAYPLDCWRFYPDAGRALASWARDQTYDVNLVESFTAARARDQWNDYVIVFRKGKIRIEQDEYLYMSFGAQNVRLNNVENIIQFSAITEDGRIIEELNRRVKSMEIKLKSIMHRLRLRDRSLVTPDAPNRKTEGSPTELLSNNVARLAPDLFEMADSLKSRLTLHGSVVSRLLAFTRMPDMGRPEWIDHLRTACALDGAMRSHYSNSPDLVLGPLQSYLVTDAVHQFMNLMRSHEKIVLITFHGGFPLLARALFNNCCALLQRGQTLGRGGTISTKEPRQALFEAYKAVVAGQPLLLAPDGPDGGLVKSYELQVLGKAVAIADGAAYLIHETGAQPIWYTVLRDGKTFYPVFDLGPRREKSEPLNHFRPRLYDFYASKINEIFTGHPQNLMLRFDWQKVFTTTP